LETRLDTVKPPIPQPRTTMLGTEGKRFSDSRVLLFAMGITFCNSNPLIRSLAGLPPPRRHPGSGARSILGWVVRGSVERNRDALGSCFYREFAVGPDGPQEPDLFTSLLVAETAETDRPLSGFRHEPRGLGYRLGILAPGTLNCIPWEESDLTQAKRRSDRRKISLAYTESPQG